MREKQRSSRKSFQQEGWVGIGDGFAARKCRIVNVSESGARLLLDDPNFVTGRFKLKMTRSSEGRDCKIVWRKAREFGAEFV